MTTLTSAHFLAACPFCQALPAARCVNPLTMLPLDWPHLERIRAAG